MATNKQRRETERRRLQRQMERRRQQQQNRKRTNLIISIVGTLIVIAAVIVLVVATNGDDSKPKPAAKASSPASTAPASTVPASTAPASSPSATAASYPCTWTKSAAAAKAATMPTSTKPPKTGKVTVSVATTQGKMTFALDRSLAPCTVASFVSLVEQKYYDSTPCHRLVTSGIFVLQCGDPTGTGSGDPGYSIPDEATGKETYPAGTIAMARTSEAHSGGSQFFIVYKDSPSLAQNLGALQYTVFGKVSQGLDVATKVAAAGAATGTDGKPKLPITLSKVMVEN